MSADPRLGLVLGYDRLGAVKHFTQLLRRYGRDRVVALVNRPELQSDIHLGQDLFEALLRRHLRIPAPATRPGWVTGQLPLYADRAGTVQSIEGLDAARALAGVEFAQQVVWPGDVITRTDCENYFAFFCLHAPSHAEVRALGRQVQALVTVHWHDE